MRKGMTPKESPVNIFFASNDKYTPYLAVAITSVCCNSSSTIDFYIIDSGISEDNQKELEDIKNQYSKVSIIFIKIDKNKLLINFPSTGYISIDTYSRLFITELVPEIERAIYLDVDIIALGDIKELFKEDIGECMLGAVAEDIDCKNEKMRELMAKIYRGSEISKEHSYFNPGVMLMDCEKWRNNKIVNRVLDIERKTRGTRLMNDMDILNKCFENNYYRLPDKYNSMDPDEKATDIIIRHFGGPVKPWMYDTDGHGRPMVHYNDFWVYAKKTAFYDQLQKDYKSQSIKTRAYLAIKKKCPSCAYFG